MSGHWRIELLGDLRAGLGEQDPASLPRQKATALLAYLAYFSRHPHAREALIELLWPEVEPETGRLNLRVTLHTLRRLLEERGRFPTDELLIARRATVHLEPAAFTTDVAEFRAALQSAAELEALRPRAERLSAAIALYGGELLPGSFEPWVLTEREHLARLYLEALQQVAWAREELGDLPAALEAARKAVAADPLREEAHYEVMRLYAATGQPSACLQQYEEMERVLREELGETPSAEARALAEELQENARRLVVARRESSPRRHGDTEEGSQWKERTPVGVRPQAPPPSPSVSPCLRGDPSSGEFRATGSPLPQPLTRFFGREEEIARLTELLASPTTRLVTVTGPGGSGKTRLAIAVLAKSAIQAEHRHEPFDPGPPRAGMAFVPLADLTDPQRLIERIAGALGLERAPDTAPLEQVVDHLRRQPWLLVLDNFEQLVSGHERSEGPEAESGALQVRALLERVPSLTCLVTSRLRLGLSGEQELLLLPLPTPRPGGVRCRVLGVGTDKDDCAVAGPNTQHPTPNTLMSFPSIQLFVDRARAVRPDFQVTEANAAAIAALCDRLEGLPLALELAAARTRLLTPEQILARLSSRFELLESRQRDLPARHRSLRAAMEWSYQLLSPELQQFFARLSVFRGGWTLEAAEAVCGSGVRCWVLGVGESDLTPNTQHLTPTLDLLEQLQESSLLVTEEAPHGTALRYRFLETVREFAAERLPEEEREALAGRHAFYLMSLAETAEPHLAGPDHSEWLERLEAEQENFRAALDWCAGSGVRGQGSGVRSDRGEWSCPPFLSPDPITRFAGTRLSPVLIGLRLGAAMAQFWLTRGYLAEGRTWLEALLAKEEQGGCHHPLRGYAPTPWVTGEEPAGEAAISPGVRRSRVRAQLQLGMLALHHGDYDAARPLLEASLAAAQEMGEPPLLAACLLNLGVIEERTDDHPRASALIEEAVAIYRKLEDERAVATCLVTLADMARHQPDHAPARTLYQEAGSLYRALGDQRDMAWALTRLGSLAVSDGRLAEARAEHEEALALFREMEDRIGIAATLNFLAEVALPRREFHQARQLFHESLAIWRELGSRRDIIWSLKGLGSVALAEIDLETAGAYLDEALAVAWELGSPLGSDDWTQGLPWDALARPGWETAQDCFKRCVQFVREMGSPDILILMLEALGHRARAEGDHEAARRFFQASLIKRRALGDPYGLAQSLEQFAVLAGREQQAGYRVPAQRVDEAWVGAIRLLGAAEALCETLGERPPVTDPTEYERTLTEGRAALGEATFAAAWEEGRALPPGQAVEAALGEA